MKNIKDINEGGNWKVKEDEGGTDGRKKGEGRKVKVVEGGEEGR